IYRQDGSLYSTTQMQYDVSGQKMYHTYSKNSVKGTGIPDSNLDEDFTAKVVIFDNAGNSRTLPTQKFRYDNTLIQIRLPASYPGFLIIRLTKPVWSLTKTLFD
ncbi:Ig-like domain repeat protein, partial [Enterobacter hormaechei]